MQHITGHYILYELCVFDSVGVCPPRPPTTQRGMQVANNNVCVCVSVCENKQCASLRRSGLPP